MTINYKMLLHLEDPNMIHNLLDKLDLDLKADYESCSYVMINHFTELIRSFEDLLINSGKVKGEKEEEEFVQDGTEEEMPYELHELACHQNECVRRYRIKADRDRAAFQRDRGRIVNSKAFRRLVDKAQIFGAQKGDHYRTRMTHTLEVNQIAKAIAYALGLNLDLTEAIVHYFINGAICYGRDRMEGYERPADGSIDKEIVTLSKADWDVCRYLEQIINRRVISSAEVARFDHTGNKIIYALFQDYYRNPRLLHKGTLQRIYSHMLQHEDASVRESAIHLGTGNMGIVKEEIRSIVEGEIGLEEEIDLPVDEFVRFEKRKILVRNITDFIAGMTDSYALQEYKRLHP